MRTYESFATELLNELIEDGVSQVDPAVILALIELLKNLLPVLLEQCKKKAQELPELARMYLDKAGVFQRMGFRLKVRRLAGAEVYNRLGGVKLPDEIAKLAATLSPDEAVALASEL